MQKVHLRCLLTALTAALVAPSPLLADGSGHSHHDAMGSPGRAADVSATVAVEMYDN